MKFSSFTFHSSLLSEIWSTSKRNKLRTSLTGFAVAWGIFMLIFLLGAGNGLINAQLQQSDRFLANSMVVYGQNTSKAYNGLKEGRPIDLNDKDMLITDHVYAHQVGDVGGQLQQYSRPDADRCLSFPYQNQQNRDAERAIHQSNRYAAAQKGGCDES